MASFDNDLKVFVSKWGEDAVKSALANYENQRERSVKASQKAQAQRQGLNNLIAKAKSDPRVAELLKAAGVSV